MKNITLKTIGLGIAIMLAGIYINLEIGLSQYLYGKEFYIVLLGFIIVLVGVFTKD